MSKNQAELGERTEHLLALVEETEFGIALPTTLRILSREMRSIEGWLKAGDVAARTIAMETRIEEDLLGADPVGPPAPAHNSAGPGAPLSVGTEGTRARAEPSGCRAQDGPDDPVAAQRRHRRSRQDPPCRNDLPPDLKHEVETLEATQDEIRDSLAKIGERLPFPEGLE